MNTPPKTRILVNIAWAIATRWSSKFIGMINTIVLARLLVPEDFGIVAMATVVLAMLESTTEVGIRLYVIRSEDTNPRLYYAGWTVGVIQASVVALILCAAAPAIANFFGEPAVREIIYCLCVIRLINGLKSFGLVMAQKALDFSVDFKVTFISRMTYLAVSIISALLLKNYWALVIGQFSAAIVGLVVSYAIHPFRPKFDLYNWRDMLKFSYHTLPMSIGRFINNQLHVLVIGRVAPTEFLGKYNVGASLGTLFTRQLMAPVLAGLLPNLSILRNEDNFLKFLKLAFATAVYCFLPIGVGLALVSTEVVEILLGDKWKSTAGILFWLALYGMTAGILMFISEQFLIIVNQEKLSNRLMWMRNALLVICLSAALTFWNYEIVPAAIFASVALAMPPTLYFVSRSLDTTIGFLVSDWWPALIAAGAMAAALTGIPWPDWPVFIVLMLKCLVAALAYTGCLGLIYLLRGRPPLTPEATLEQQLRKRLPGLMQRSAGQG